MAVPYISSDREILTHIGQALRNVVTYLSMPLRLHHDHVGVHGPITIPHGIICLAGEKAVLALEFDLTGKVGLRGEAYGAQVFLGAVGGHGVVLFLNYNILQDVVQPEMTCSFIVRILAQSPGSVVKVFVYNVLDQVGPNDRLGLGLVYLQRLSGMSSNSSLRAHTPWP